MQEKAEACDVIPEIETMDRWVRLYKTTKDLFKLDQIINIAMCIDLEETNRRTLTKAFRTVFKHFSNDYPPINTEEEWINYHHIFASSDRVFKVTPEQITDLLSDSLKKLNSGYKSEFYRVMIEIINKIRQPLDAVEMSQEGVPVPLSLMKRREIAHKELMDLEETIQ